MKSTGEGKSLWEREFKRVKWGLDEEQVVAFVNDISKERDGLLDKQRHLASLQKLAEKTVMEANTLAESIKREAQNEATRLIDEAQAEIQKANDQAENIRQEAQNEAGRLTEEAEAESREASELAENLKREAQEKAARLTEEAETKIREADELAEAIKQEAEEKVVKLVKEAEQKTREADDLSESIKQEAREKAEKMIAEAEEKAGQIRAEAQAQLEKAGVEANEMAEGIRGKARGEALRMAKDAEEKSRQTGAEVQGQAEKVRAEANGQAERIKQQAEGEAARLIKEAEIRIEEMRADAMRLAEEEAQEQAEKVLEEARLEAETVIDASKKHVLDQMSSIRDKFMPHLGKMVAEIEAIGGGGDAAKKSLDGFTLAAPVRKGGNNGDGGSNNAEADLESESATPASSQAEGKNAAATPVEDVAATESLLQEGEIEVNVTPPFDAAQVMRLQRNLQKIPRLKILRTAGSWDGGSNITVNIDKSVPLLNILSRMPEVESAEVAGAQEAGGNGDDFLRGVAFDGKPGNGKGRNIVVLLKKGGESEERPGPAVRCQPSDLEAKHAVHGVSRLNPPGRCQTRYAPDGEAEFTVPRQSVQGEST